MIIPPPHIRHADKDNSEEKQTGYTSTIRPHPLNENADEKEKTQIAQLEGRLASLSHELERLKLNYRNKENERELLEEKEKTEEEQVVKAESEIVRHEQFLRELENATKKQSMISKSKIQSEKEELRRDEVRKLKIESEISQEEARIRNIEHELNTARIKASRDTADIRHEEYQLGNMRRSGHEHSREISDHERRLNEIRKDKAEQEKTVRLKQLESAKSENAILQDKSRIRDVESEIDKHEALLNRLLHQEDVDGTIIKRKKYENERKLNDLVKRKKDEENDVLRAKSALNESVNQEEILKTQISHLTKRLHNLEEELNQIKGVEVEKHYGN